MDTSPRALPRRALPPLQSTTDNKSNVSKTTHEDVDDRALPTNASSSTMSKSRTARQKKKLRQSSQMIQPPQEEDTSNREVTQLENGDQVSELTVSTTSKRARTRRRQANKSRSSRPEAVPQVVTNGYALTSMLSEEDVVAVDHIDSSAMTTLPGVAGSGGNSQPTEKVFVQTTSGFATHTNQWLANRQIIAAQKSTNASNDDFLITQTSQVALSFHRAFIFLIFLIHGILAGLAIWEVVIAFSLSATGANNFFTQYAILAQPTQTIYYILLAMCLVSAMDRYNFAKPGRTIFYSLIKIEPTAWSVVAYFLAFMFNTGLSGVDYWLGQIAPGLQLNQTEFPVTPAYLNQFPNTSLSTWHAINVLRAVFSVIGWFILAAYPTEDDTAKNLFASNDDN